MKYSAAQSLVWLLLLSSRVFGSYSFHQISTVRSSSRVVAPKSGYPLPLVASARRTTTTSPSSIGMGLSVALRGGAVVGTAVTNALKCDGPFGILGLAAISSSVIAPLTLYRQVYSFTFGYSFAMMSIGLALRKIFHARGPASALLTALVVYGAKHLLLRECTVQSMRLKNFDQTNFRLARPHSNFKIIASLSLQSAR